MASNTSSTSETEAALTELARLRRFAGPPTEFWPSFLSASGRLIGASRGVLIHRDTSQPPQLRKLSDWSGNGHADRATMLFTNALAELAEETLKSGRLNRVLESSPSGRALVLGISLPLLGSNAGCAALFLMHGLSDDQAEESLLRLNLVSDLPAAYQTNQSAQQSRHEVETLGAVMDVLVLVNKETRFLASSLALCNALATRFQCERVSLGWLQQGYVRLKTISRTERFNRNMATVKALEVAMEECLDQNAELIVPAPENFQFITKDTTAFAQEQKSGNVLSVPIRVEDKAVAVVLCERQAKPFTQLEVEQVRLTCDQVARRVADLQKIDRWFGARWAHTLKEQLAKVLGPEHTWAKVLAVLGAAALVVLVLPIFPYRVEGSFILRSDEVSYLTAPFDGYIKSVEVRPGDTLPPGGPLLKLNTDDLQLEEAGAIADQNRYLREAEKARAKDSSAEMRIALALADQAKAKLDMVHYRLGQALLKSPFAGVVVEGDLRQRVGAPVKQGDALFKVARIDNLYVEAEVQERDIHEIIGKSKGEIAFVAQPKLKFPMHITRLEPAAVAKDKKNVFQVRCALDGPVQPWWRPGMSGVCKISIEHRPLWWVLTHRTVDFLRLLLWW